ncbi:hypothetical protein VVD49_03965 [Uliginosibacterium sp. H3]|uniref:DUF7660 domain-containing protein n=1 Tax=Uliginosibacterium silvisoli TaxID=3114758 RepID=A0ABU6K0B2_9RHOO|nr:hypothetical protein [Uliginosibacterium sp. H3]
MTDPHDLLGRGNDEKSFMEFVRELQADFQANKESWENITVDGFLEAAAAWGESTDVGATQGLASASPWKRFASFLYCGKIYE